MDRKRTRSNSGWRELLASSSTRVLNASHESSRLMKRRGLSAVMAAACSAGAGALSVSMEVMHRGYRLFMTVSWQLANQLVSNTFLATLDEDNSPAAACEIGPGRAGPGRPRPAAEPPGGAGGPAHGRSSADQGAPARPHPVLDGHPDPPDPGAARGAPGAARSADRAGARSVSRLGGCPAQAAARSARQGRDRAD